MKSILSLLSVLLIGSSLMAQTFKGQESKIQFFSETPLEDIKAVNVKSSGVIRASDNKVAIVVPMKSFKFEKALMEEHFNENYLESDIYKNGTFLGKFNEDINWKKNGEYDASVTGKLKIHGVEQERTLKGKLVIKGGEVNLNCKFKVKLVDFNIEIPKAVFMNIAEEIDVTMEMKLSSN